jgi:hypothetical protein
MARIMQSLRTIAAVRRNSHIAQTNPEQLWWTVPRQQTQRIPARS